MSGRFENLGQVVQFHAKNRGDATAFSFAGRSTSFAQVEDHCRGVAAALLAAGAERGARVAFLGKNSDLFFELLLGAAMVGVVVVPLNWRLTPAELETILADAQAQLFFASADFYETGLRLGSQDPHLKGVIEIEPGIDATRHFTAWRDAADRLPQGAEIASREDGLLQLYTSGTTGRPKGVMLSHGSVLGALEAADAIAEPWRTLSPEAVALVAMPAFHVSGSGWALGCFHGGGRCVILPEFSVAGVDQAITQQGVTHAMVVPTALQLLVDKWASDASPPVTLKQIVYGASPMPPVLLKRCLELLGCDFVQYYGMTETCGSVVALTPDDHTASVGERLRSTGRAMAGVEVQVVGANGAALPPMTVGEVLVRTPGVMTGYWNLPEATRDALDAAGWVHTGDAGYLDADGYLYLCDRIKDMIISGGENIYPTEVENALLSHPAVAEAAVIGVPDERWGESVKAVVVLRDGQSVSAEALIAHVRQRIAGYKTPKSVDFAASLPRNASGKVLKRALREPYWAGHDRAVA